MGSMLSGVFGAVAGNWLYDSFLRPQRLTVRITPVPKVAFSAPARAPTITRTIRTTRLEAAEIMTAAEVTWAAAMAAAATFKVSRGCFRLPRC